MRRLGGMVRVAVRQSFLPAGAGAEAACPGDAFRIMAPPGRPPGPAQRLFTTRPVVFGVFGCPPYMFVSPGSCGENRRLRARWPGASARRPALRCRGGAFACAARGAALPAAWPDGWRVAWPDGWPAAWPDGWRAVRPDGWRAAWPAAATGAVPDRDPAGPVRYAHTT